MKVIFQGCAILLASVCIDGLMAADEDEVPAAIPDWEIHLFDLVENEKGYRIENGSTISSNKGYDNQPYFTPGSESILFSSERDGTQTDIYEYFISSKKTEQITDTKSSEYTPKMSPDNLIITFVRDGEGANPDQTVWKLNRKTGETSWAINSKEPVGYYHLNHETGDVLFWSRYGFSVQYLNIKKNLDRYVSGNAVPGTPKQVPGTDLFSFVHRQMNGEVWIKSFNPETHAITPLAPVEGTNSDYAWAPNGDLFRAEDNVLYVWKKSEASKQWTKVQDMSAMFNGTVFRLAISPDGNMMALVENP
jgi:WD40 repeat protein